MANTAMNIVETPADKLARLERENDALKAKLAASDKPRSLKCKVGQAGGVSVYGLGRFPVTLYREQWERLISFSSDITEFIAANDKVLKVKA